MVKIEKPYEFTAPAASCGSATCLRDADNCSSTTSCSPRASTAGQRGLVPAARCSSIRSATCPTCTHVTRPFASSRGASGQHRAIQKTHGAGRSPGSRRPAPNSIATSESPPTRARPSASASSARRRLPLPHLLHVGPRRRVARQRLDVPRPDAARPSGRMGSHSRAAGRRRLLTNGVPPRRLRNPIRRMLLVRSAVAEPRSSKRT